jgi:hypothetical protein
MLDHHSKADNANSRANATIPAGHPNKASSKADRNRVTSLSNPIHRAMPATHKTATRREEETAHKATIDLHNKVLATKDRGRVVPKGKEGNKATNKAGQPVVRLNNGHHRATSHQNRPNRLQKARKQQHNYNA